MKTVKQFEKLAQFINNWSYYTNNILLKPFRNLCRKMIILLLDKN